MNRNALISLGMAAAANRLRDRVSDLRTDDLLGLVGLERRRSRLFEQVCLVAAGAVVGAGAALLLAPATGRETRAKVSNRLNEVGSTVERRVSEAAKDVRAQIEHARGSNGNAGATSGPHSGV